MQKVFKAGIPALVLLLLTMAGNAQYVCGTSGETGERLIPRLEQNLKSAGEQAVSFRSTQYVPVKFHLVAKTDGSGRVSEAKVLEMLCALNEDFADLDIQFFIKGGFNEINNTVVYDNHVGTQNTIMKLNRDDQAINIFILNDATSGNNSPGVTLGYYTPTFDWIVMRRDQVNANSITLTHEMGHFFSLPHPHRGWDSEPYDQVKHGDPAPATSPGGVPTERQDGSNCTTAGDLICDTPPDYNGLGWPNCNYTGAKDPTGTPINPEEKLFMSYFDNCPIDSYFFTPVQKQAMIADLASAGRNYLRIAPPPSPDQITTLPQATFPVNNEQLAYYNAVNFQWTAAPGAGKYLLEIGRSSAFTDNTTVRFIVFGTNKVVNNLESDRIYYWRVTPFNDYYTCANASANASFRTGTLTSASGPAFIDGWSVAPNPVFHDQELQVRIRTRQAFDGSVRLFGLDGRQVLPALQRTFSSGDHQITLPVQNLAPGIYLLLMETGQGRLSQKVLVN